MLAILIGAVIVGNTMLLSLFERTHEFGLMRAVGWTAAAWWRSCSARALLLPSFGAALGVASVLRSLRRGSPTSRRSRAYCIRFHTRPSSGERSYTALGMTLIGALYPTHVPPSSHH